MEIAPIINLVQGQGPSIRRFSQKLEAFEGDLMLEDSLLLNVVVGKVKDVRDFQERTIQGWVYLKWTTHDEITIKKKWVSCSSSFVLTLEIGKIYQH